MKKSCNYPCVPCRVITVNHGPFLGGRFSKINHHQEIGCHYFNRKMAHLDCIWTLLRIDLHKFPSGIWSQFSVLKGFGLIRIRYDGGNFSNRQKRPPTWQKMRFYSVNRSVEYLKETSFIFRSDSVIKSYASNYSELQLQIQSWIIFRTDWSYLQSDVATWYHHKAVVDPDWLVFDSTKRMDDKRDGCIFQN